MTNKGYMVLANGQVFEGKQFGAPAFRVLLQCLP
jgi:hypothetical protein